METNKTNKVNKKIIIIISAILIIAIIIAVALKITNQKELTIKMYNKICNSENYTFEIIGENSEIDYTLKIGKKDNNSFCIDIISEDTHSTTLVDEGKGYYIDHNNKEYFEYEDEQIDADILKSDLSGIETLEYQTGYETINGKKYFYEEYENISTFLMFLNYTEDSILKTRFYFDGSNIAYIKNIIEEDEELLKINFSNTIDENLFKIPDEYAET